MNSIKKAREITVLAKRNQFHSIYDFETAYIDEVVSRCEGRNQKIVALLQNILNSTNITMDYLVQHFTDEVLCAVKIINKDPAISEDEYYEKIKTNELARIVKIITIEVELGHVVNDVPLNQEMIIRSERLRTYFKKRLEYLSAK